MAPFVGGVAMLGRTARVIDIGNPPPAGGVIPPRITSCSPPRNMPLMRLALKDGAQLHLRARPSGARSAVQSTVGETPLLHPVQRLDRSVVAPVRGDGRAVGAELLAIRRLRVGAATAARRPV